MKRVFFTFGAALCALMFAAPSQAQVYKWTDAQGRLHFSDKAPANQKAHVVDLPAPEPAVAVPDVSEQERLARQQRLVKTLEEDRLEKERQKAAAQAERDKRAAYCERFENRLTRLEASERVYRENTDGTVSYYSEADAERLKLEKRAQFQQECVSA